MVTPEFRSNSRHEFNVAELGYERTGGCFVTYRKIAFAFVFFLALCIIAAFVGVYIGSPPDKDVSIGCELNWLLADFLIWRVFGLFHCLSM